MRRPTESLEAYLPTFDAHGVHERTPAELSLAARAEELLDRQMLAANGVAHPDRMHRFTV